MHKYGAFCDEFYVNMHLGTEMDLPQGREPILHFFEQVQKRFPRMTNFYAREKGEFCLEEEKDSGSYRWLAIETRRICSGSVNPESLESAMEQHNLVLGLAPFELSVSHLDCESLNLTLGFDYMFRGNHNELLAEALGVAPPFEPLSEIKGSTLLSYEPMVQFALDDECKTQFRIGCESRTTAYQVRTGEFSEDPVSVYLTVRRFGSLASGEDFVTECTRIAALAEQLVDQYVVEQVLQPLKKTIAIK